MKESSLGTQTALPACCGVNNRNAITSYFFIRDLYDPSCAHTHTHTPQPVCVSSHPWIGGYITTYFYPLSDSEIYDHDLLTRWTKCGGWAQWWEGGAVHGYAGGGGNRRKGSVRWDPLSWIGLSVAVFRDIFSHAAASEDTIIIVFVLRWGRVDSYSLTRAPLRTKENSINRNSGIELRFEDIDVTLS